MCQAVLPTMRKQKSGTIINVSSIAAQMGLPFRAIYSALMVSSLILQRLDTGKDTILNPRIPLVLKKCMNM